MFVGRVTDKILDHTQQALVGLEFDEGTVGQFLFGDGAFHLQLDIDHVVPAPEGLDIGFAAGQSLIDECQTLVDELGRVDGLLVFFLLAALIIQVDERVEHVTAASLDILKDAQVDAVGLLGDELDLDFLVQALSAILRPDKRCRDVARFLGLVILGGLDGECAV